MSRALLVVMLAAAACTTSAGPAAADCPSSNPPNELVLVGGTPQTAQLNTQFAQPLQVTLANSNGCPVTTGAAGEPITFTAPGSGASGTFAGSGSNTVTVGVASSGDASAQLTANGEAGSYTVTASSRYGKVSFSLINTAAGIPVSIVPVAPTSRSAVGGRRYQQPLAVTVLDANGQPVPNVAVTFSLAGAAGAAGATFDGGSTQATETTNAAGVATSPGFTANAIAGAFFAAASVQGIVEPTEFSLHNLAASPTTLTALLPVRMSATVGTGYAKPLEVKVRDGDRVPLAGATVTFTIGGASGSAAATFADGSPQAMSTTNAHGVAISPRLLANTVAGAFTVAATMTGAPHGAAFALRNRVGRPASIVAGVGSSESATAGTRFPVRFAVIVTDRYGNAVRGASVTFVAPAHGASGRFGDRGRRVTVKTDQSGVAGAPPFVANGNQGGYVVRASVAGRRTAFALVNLARP